MVRVTYSDSYIQECSSQSLAKLAMMEMLSLSQGNVRPVAVTEILGITTGGVSVEMDLKLDIAYSKKLGGWMVALNEIPRR